MPNEFRKTKLRILYTFQLVSKATNRSIAASCAILTSIGIMKDVKDLIETLPFNKKTFFKKSNYVDNSVRSSHQRCSIKKGALRNFAKFTGKHLCQSLFLIKLHLFYKTPPGDCFC